MTIDIVDMHVHLLAGLDDGPRTAPDALEMARLMVADGVTESVALAHQHPRYPENSAVVLRDAVERLREDLAAAQIPLQVYPCGEVCLQPDLLEKWDAGELLSVADRRQFLLLEFFNDQATDLTHLIEELRARKLRVILAHAERVSLWRDEPERLIEWVRRGCLVQVTSSALANPDHEKRLRDWARRGLIHLIGSDGHSTVRRPPYSRAGVEKLHGWIGPEATRRIASEHARTILRGEPLILEPPTPSGQSWFSRWFGS